MNFDVITGGAGFIGVNLAKRLIAEGRTPYLIDNLSGGRLEFLDALAIRDRVRFLEADMADAEAVLDAFDAIAREGAVGDVWHLCANSDIAAGVDDPNIDLANTFLSTHTLLGAMRAQGLTRLHFSSTSAVYGDRGDVAIHEDMPTRPISNYGAMKLASEAAISAAAESFLTRATILRFPNVVGTPATHGVIFDFIRRLMKNPARLDVLGDGAQQKPYLHIDDLIAAIVDVSTRGDEKVTIVNIGPPDAGVSVREIAEMVCARVAPGAAIGYGRSKGGWVGDVPKFRFSTARLSALGVTPARGSHAAIAAAIEEIAAQLGAPAP